MEYKDEEITVKNYQCKKLGGACNPTYTKRLFLNGDGEVYGNPSFFYLNCNEKYNCGIINSSGTIIWKDCEFNKENPKMFDL